MLKKIIVGGVIGGAAIFGIGAVDHTTRDASGVIVGAGELGAFVTKVGDCFKVLPKYQEGGLTTVSTVPGVPCTDPHHWQVFHKEDLNLSEFSRTSIISEGERVCGVAIKQIMTSMSAEKYDEYKNADFSDLGPTELSWQNQDRTIDCLVGSETEYYLTSFLSS